MASYSLRHGGHDLVVETWTDPQESKLVNRARLLVDGDEVDVDGSEEVGSVRLAAESDHPVTVRWWWTGRVMGVDLLVPGPGDERRRRLPFAPPAGTRAARRHAWAEAHPGLWAARHVLINVGGTAAAVIGIGALISALVGGLLPSVGSLDLPDVDWPDWLKYLDPGRYLGPLLGWVPPLLDTVFGWLPDGPWVKYVLGFLFAVGVAVREARRRKRATAERDHDGS